MKWRRQPEDRSNRRGLPSSGTCSETEIRAGLRRDILRVSDMRARAFRGQYLLISLFPRCNRAVAISRGAKMRNFRIDRRVLS